MSTSEPQTRMAFPPQPPYWPALIMGALTFVAGCLAWAFLKMSHVTNPWVSVLHPAASLGHALFVGLTLALVGEWRRRRVAQQEFQRSIIDGVKTRVTEQWEQCRLETRWGDDNGPEAAPRRGEALSQYWSKDLDSRWVVYLCIALAAFLLGLLVSLLALPGSDQPMPPAADLLLPWAVGSVETLVIGVGVLVLRRAWHRLLHAWVETLRNVEGAALRLREQELEAREDDLRTRERKLASREAELNAREGLVPTPDGSHPFPPDPSEFGTAPRAAGHQPGFMQQPDPAPRSEGMETERVPPPDLDW